MSQACGILLKFTNFNSNLSKWPNSPFNFRGDLRPYYYAKPNEFTDKE